MQGKSTSREEGNCKVFVLLMFITIIILIVFRAKVLESHAERLYGSTAEESSSETESISSRESSPPQAGLADPDHYVKKDSETISIHEQHERFMQKQIQLAASYKEEREQLPRTISSKRSTATTNEESCEDLILGKKAKLTSEVEKAIEQDSGVQKGPRTVSKAEKNRRRKLKKKRRLTRKS